MVLRVNDTLLYYYTHMTTLIFGAKYSINWRINEVKLWNSSIAIKTRALLHWPILTRKEVVSYFSVQHANGEEWFSSIKKYMHLMPQWPYSSDTKAYGRKYVCLETINIWLKETYKY